MSFLRVLGSAFLAFVLWRIFKKLTAPKSPLADVAGPTKEHWLKGNYHRIFQDGLEYNLGLAEKYGGAVKIHALLGDEQLYVSDPRALHHIVVKEQHVYEETDMFIMGNRLIFGEGLIATLGDQHKKQRKMLNPVFSLANMRDLLPIIQPIANQLRDIFLSQIPSDGRSQEINVLPWLSRGALEYICQAGLGYSFDALDVTKTNEYVEALKMLAPTGLRIILLRPFVPLVMRNLSLYWRNKLVDWLPIKPLKELQRIVGVMDTAGRRIFAEKKSAMDQTNGHDSRLAGNLRERMKGKDIMSIMLRANASSDVSDRLTESELLGQMNTIIFAGFETTTTAICRILYILASRPEVQARLRSEVRKAKCDYGGSKDGWEDVNLPYDTLVGLPYLDAVVRETLRVHPPTSLLSRTTRAATTLPLQYPVQSVSGAEVSSIPLPANTTVIISILASNHNKKIWGEDASVWRPERWLTASGERIQLGKDTDGTLVDNEGTSLEGAAEGAPGNRDGVKYPGVYASMMTFLGGGRACIGFKFAEMEMKQVLSTLLSTMQFSLPSTPDEHGNLKEIYWKMNGLQVPVVRPPSGDNQTAQVPLQVRLVREEDFLA